MSASIPCDGNGASLTMLVESDNEEFGSHNFSTFSVHFEGIAPSFLGAELEAAKMGKFITKNPYHKSLEIAVKSLLSHGIIPHAVLDEAMRKEDIKTAVGIIMRGALPVLLVIDDLISKYPDGTSSSNESELAYIRKVSEFTWSTASVNVSMSLLKELENCCEYRQSRILDFEMPKWKAISQHGMPVSPSEKEDGEIRDDSIRKESAIVFRSVSKEGFSCLPPWDLGEFEHLIVMDPESRREIAERLRALLRQLAKVAKMSVINERRSYNPLTIVLRFSEYPYYIFGAEAQWKGGELEVLDHIVLVLAIKSFSCIFPSNLFDELVKSAILDDFTQVRLIAEASAPIFEQIADMRRSKFMQFPALKVACDTMEYKTDERDQALAIIRSIGDRFWTDDIIRSVLYQ